MRPYDLQQATALWVHLFQLAAGTAPGSGTAYCAVSADFWGFPRREAESFRQAMLGWAAAHGVTGLRAEFADADTLRIGGPVCPVEPLPDFTGWFGFCLTGPADGKVCSFRLTAKETPEPGEATRGRGSTLVLFGQARDGCFVLKAMWPASRRDARERIYEFAPWPYEKEFLALLEAPPSYVTSAQSWAKQLFVSGADGATASAVSWFFVSGERKLGSYLARLGLAGGIAALSMVMMVRLRETQPLAAVMLFGPLFLLATAGLIFHLWLKIRMLCGYRFRMRDGLKRVYSRPVAFPPADLDALDAWSDPATRKLTSDIEATGAKHVCDIRIDPPIAGQRFTRIYLLANGCTALSISPMYGTQNHASFPALPVFMARAYLSDDTQIVTTNSRIGYRRPLPLPHRTISRGYPDVRDVESMIQRHEDLLRRHETAGNRRVPMDPATIVDRMVEDHEAARPLMAQRGYYGWGDAFRETFDIVRKEYRD